MPTDEYPFIGGYETGSWRSDTYPQITTFKIFHGCFNLKNGKNDD
jgi:hypothetical protein